MKTNFLFKARRWLKRLQRMLYIGYDRLFTAINFPTYYCSRCERRIRFWVYRFNGLIHCQDCADDHVDQLKSGLEDNGWLHF